MTAAIDVAPEGTRILLVEDNRAQAEAIALLLGRGVIVVHASDGQSAIELLAGGATFDVVLSDISMPRMGGPALLERIRAEHPNLVGRVVFVTSDPETPVARALAKTHGVLRKPTTPNALRIALHQVLSGGRSP